MKKELEMTWMQVADMALNRLISKDATVQGLPVQAVWPGGTNSAPD